MARPHIGWFSVGTALWASTAIGQSDPLGIQFVTVGSPGNPAYQSANPNDFVNGRGACDEAFRIGQFEVNTQQWVAFYNAAYDRPATDRIPFVTTPTFWGAIPTTPNTPGGLRWTVPSGNEMRPAGNISWRTAAILCNWLCHGANANAPRTDFLDGAYAVSTFGQDANNIFTDQPAHSPGAQYFLPTWDMWLKAAHWSPNNPSNNGWYTYSNSSDTPYVYGPPGVGQANAGFQSPSPYSILLGSYPTVQSPWGLLDVAGGTTEWTESIKTINTGQRYRVFDGSSWGLDPNQSSLMDQVREWGAEYPFVDSHEFGFRIASSIPSPGPCALGVGTVLWLASARRRQDRCHVSSPSSRPSRPP